MKVLTLTLTLLIFFFFFTHLGLSLNYIFAFLGHFKGAYLCLAEVKWVKAGAPGVKPLLGVKGWVP